MSDLFALEPTNKDGTPSEAVISELRGARRRAKDLAEAYSDAAKTVADRHRIKSSALKRYIAALEDDKTDEALAEAHDLERLLDG